MLWCDISGTSGHHLFLWFQLPPDILTTTTPVANLSTINYPIPSASPGPPRPDVAATPPPTTATAAARAKVPPPGRGSKLPSGPHQAVNAASAASKQPSTAARKEPTLAYDYGWKRVTGIKKSVPLPDFHPELALANGRGLKPKSSFDRVKSVLTDMFPLYDR